MEFSYTEHARNDDKNNVNMRGIQSPYAVDVESSEIVLQMTCICVLYRYWICDEGR